MYIEQGCDIQKEYYVGFVIDRATDRITLMASEEGGTEIEEVVAKTPEKSLKKQSTQLLVYHLIKRVVLLSILIFQKNLLIKRKFLISLYNVFIEKDCSIVEINPLVTTGEGEVLALDAKINFDDNALFRHKDIQELRDLEEEDPKEIEASKYDLSYIALDGDIGCMVNGAGLAMATMDTINHFGGNPANFLDVGATKEKVTEAFKIILGDDNVKGIFVNIFGGIMKCDVIAEGIVATVKEVELTLPLVVRLEGTNVERGKEILNESGLAIEPALQWLKALKNC